MDKDRTPTVANEEEWILKYRAALNAQYVQQSRSKPLHQWVSMISRHVVPASQRIVHHYIRPMLEKAFAAVRRELLHFY